MKTQYLVSLVLFLASWRTTHAHALLTKPISKQGGNENSYKVAPGEHFALASWWLDRAHFDKDPLKTPFTRPGEFSYKEARTCCGVNQVFHPCGCRVGADINTCAAVTAGRGFGELIGLPSNVPEKVSMGGKLKTKFNMHANHAGGYTYSLCPKKQYDSCFDTHKPKSGAVDAPSTLAYLKCVWDCFQANPLPFAGEQKLQLRGTEANHVKMNAVSKIGKSGSRTATYREVPIADVGSNSNSWQYVKSFSSNEVKAQFAADFGPEAPKGKIQVGPKGHNPTEWQVVDEVEIPAPTSGGLAAGQYLLSWRYDCGTANQIWTNCADVELVVGPVPTPDPDATTVAATTTQPPAGQSTSAAPSKEYGMCQNCAVGSQGQCKGGASGTGCWSYSDPANKLCPPGTKPCFKDNTPAKTTGANAPAKTTGGNAPAKTTKAADGSCSDTADWHNNFARPLGCRQYISNGYCDPDTRRAGFGKQWTLGSHYNHPERHCCACGKGTSYMQTVENFEKDGLLERGNRDTQMGKDNPVKVQKKKDVVDASTRGFLSWSLGAIGTLIMCLTGHL